MSEILDANFMKDKVAHIRHLMAQAAKSAGRQPEDVLLCAACKSRTAETVRESALLLVDLFGENKTQEMAAHFNAGAYLGKPCHFIGHLQTNKVKITVGMADMIQSVDSLRLLESINTQAAGQKLCQDILFQINLGEEAGKDGAAAGDLWPLLEAAAGMRNICVRGLMAIPPISDILREDRRYFVLLRELMEKARTYCYENATLDTLSMGMTDSYEAAILEGATLIRVGTGIYGPRE